jgi:acetyl/propionyl-CoA carboxylase alpha subunit
MVTGLDLVEWQLRVAAGELLPLGQNQIELMGHAVEARLYAENPQTGFLPSTGRLDHFRLPGTVRIDAGVEEEGEVTPFYDPMIAKLIAYAPTREAAISELCEACDEVEVWPVKTNAGFLARCLEAPAFIAGDVDTGFIERNLDELVPDPDPDETIWRGAASVALAIDEEDEPLADLAGFRMNAAPKTSVGLGRGGEFRSVALDDDVPMAAVSGFRDDERVVVFTEGQAYEFELASRGLVGGHGIHDGEIVAPMPGRVTAVEVAAGEAVTKGQRLLTLEAMKMEHGLVAPFDGTVAEVAAEAGAQVGEGALLARVEPSD